MATNKDDMIYADITGAIDVFDSYKAIQETQKMRGKNNFNPLTILLDPSDEVRLHSRFLHNLLSPVGTHCQGSLFLDIFLKTCGLDSFSINTEKCVVNKEYDSIDLYITDKNKHIIIENKIYAADQDKQIERYINKIKKENLSDHKFSDNLVVIYLSLDRNEPDVASLGSLILCDGKLINGEIQYTIKIITYEKEILNWIRSSKSEVENITNLSIGLEQYEDVILQLYNKPRGKLMSLSEYLKKENDSIKIIRTFKYIHEEFENLRKEDITIFFGGVERELKKTTTLQGWSVHLEAGNLFKSDKLVISISPHNNADVFFALGIENSNCVDLFYGIIRKDKSVNMTRCFEDSGIVSLLRKNKLKHVKKPSPGTWWLTWGWCLPNHGDVLDFILDEGGVENAVNSFVNNIIDVFIANKDIVLECNKILKR